MIINLSCKHREHKAKGLKLLWYTIHHACETLQYYCAKQINIYKIQDIIPRSTPHTDLAVSDEVGDSTTRVSKIESKNLQYNFTLYILF